jgi:hypothetical protein
MLPLRPCKRYVACDHSRIIKPGLVYYTIPRPPPLHQRSRNQPVISSILLEVQYITPIPWSLWPALCRSETAWRRLYRTYSDGGLKPRILEQPSSARPILLICNGFGPSSFQGHTICLLVILYVSLPTCDLFSHCRSLYSVCRTLCKSFDNAICKSVTAA